MEYEIFNPPGGYWERDNREWTDAEAKQFVEWIKENAEDRFRMLLDWLEIPEGNDIYDPDLLNVVGQRLAELFPHDPLSRPPTDAEVVQGIFERYQSEAEAQQRTPTLLGYSVALDAGIWLGALLVHHSNGELYWKVEKVGKRYGNHNMPVIAGFALAKGRWAYEPLFGGVSKAHAALEGDEDAPHLYRQTFDSLISKDRSPARPKKS